MSATTLLDIALSLGCWGNTSCLNNSASDDNLWNNFWQAVNQTVPYFLMLSFIKKIFQAINIFSFFEFYTSLKKATFLFNQKSLVPFNPFAFSSKVESLLKNSNLLLMAFFTDQKKLDVPFS